MNRIREVDAGYQVLVSPHRKYDVGFEFMLGSWTDEGLEGFRVLEFDTYDQAECEALRHPDINWEMLHDFHKDQFEMFYRIVKNILDYSEIAAELVPTLMKPNQIKNTMMNRVLKGQINSQSNDFRLAYDMNDIITYVIHNPWSSNLDRIRSFLVGESRLNIYKSYVINNIIHIVGRTDIGTTYEILLCPTIMYHWMKNQNKTSSSLVKVIKAQQAIDKTEPIV